MARPQKEEPSAGIAEENHRLEEEISRLNGITDAAEKRQAAERLLGQVNAFLARLESCGDDPGCRAAIPLNTRRRQALELVLRGLDVIDTLRR